MSTPTTPAPGASAHAGRDSQGKEKTSKSAHSALTSQTEEEDSTIGTAESYYQQLDDFFENSENKDAIDSAKDALSAALDVTNIKEKIDAFAQTSKIVMDGLEILGKIHPFISIAAQAFKLVIEVDLKRRENDKKVLAVQLEMQDMIVVLFLLRHIRDPKKKVDGLTVETKMRGVMESIAKHITAARSACKEYQEKGFLTKMIKCKIYEDRLADHAKIFADDKGKVQLSLALYTADGVHEINKKFDQQGAYLKEQFQKIFRELETKDERDLREFIEKNGAQNYAGNKELQQQLFAKGGKFLTPSQLAIERNSLQKELAENVDEVFKKHIALFTSQLQKQNGLVLQTMASDKEEILAALDSGPHMTIEDPDLREIWHAHHWPNPIPGQNFISGLSEYYKKKFSSQSDSKHWVLEYIEIAATNLIEAIDDDGSQLVSAEELNNFTAPKPKQSPAHRPLYLPSLVPLTEAPLGCYTATGS
ncbi:Protein kinase domain-containing protein [Mycena sanguinolenta]|uniref:Protein kinase domain-containing protein n=1 Tax=Mycena sanguinolenta TaxID=230812 RepID=A0A8H6ZIG1_9AGAR|nr:Protein kinase domain-containing protein [Mycena sanguinolenta]